MNIKLYLSIVLNIGDKDENSDEDVLPKMQHRKEEEEFYKSSCG